jgi:AcrR family transcriptional regulator
MPEYLGRGDARRSMDLLWGRSRPAKRGPKAALELESVVRAAIELADEEGLDAVSMRRVAERLEMGTMSLYTYVPGKGELLDLMVDTVYGERADERAVDPGSGLRPRLEAIARDDWAFYQRHPWTLSIATGRSVLGPNEADGYERALSVVADLGLPARDAVAIVDVVSMFVRGAARDAAEAGRAEEVTGQTEYEWWTEREAQLTEFMSAERFPTLTALGAAGGFDVPPDTENYNVRFIVDDFEFGLQRLLDGIEQYVEVRGRRPPPRQRRRSRPPRRR